MKRRIVSIICIMFLLFAITSPISGSIFSYADEPQQEQLSQDEVIKAAIALYLNERKAWITSTTSAPIDAVQAQMQTWIDSYEFWTEHTTIGSAAAFYAQCIVRYNPFRISLKGPAVRALNDLYNWLIDSGKLPNLDSDNSGGETSDSLYDGYICGDNLYYVINGNLTYGDYYSASRLGKFTSSQVKVGSPLFGQDYNYLKNYYDSQAGFTVDYSNYVSRNYPSVNYAVKRPLPNQYSGSTESTSLYIENTTYAENYRPILNASSLPSNISDLQMFNGALYCNRNVAIRGTIALIRVNYTNNPAVTYWGIVTYNATADCYYVRTMYRYGDVNQSSSQPINTQSANVNLDTDNFNKTDPTPPTGDDEVTYTPEDKTTGDTYNTYNEYITNYVTKNTVVNNNNSGGGGSDQPSGGTTPPWDGGDPTVTPDGDGFNLNLPDLTLPDLNIDWSINGLSEKFPFSIPWDLMAFFTVLNAEPETPAIEAHIDLGIVDWDIDWDLHNFDTLAALLRNLEFIGFCLALILITRSIIKG